MFLLNANLILILHLTNICIFMNIKSVSNERLRRHGSSLIYHIGALIAVTAWGIAFINTKVLLNYGLNAV